MKSCLVYSCMFVLVLSTSACTDKGSVDVSKGEGVAVLEQTAFEKNINYLANLGLELPDLAPSDSLSKETFLSLLIAAYESLGTEMDISKVNPENNNSNAVKKLTLLGVYDNYVIDDDLSTDLDYGSGAYWLMKLQDSIQKRLYARSDATATAGDLISRINVSTALHTWKQDAEETKTYSLGDLLEEEVTSDKQLTRLMTAEMFVSAYEDSVEEIQPSETTKPTDTEDINAWKANQFFFWPESGIFEPAKTGYWDDWSFMSAIVYDSQLRVGLKLEESKTYYGSVVAALTALLKAYEGTEQYLIEEKIVNNERPYDWYVSQQNSGEYSDNNCMPACVVMAMKYQGLEDTPTVEKLREDNPLNGLGWHDVLAENVMKQYGLKFKDSFDINLDKMMDLLDKGNVLYVMYWEPSIEVGHAVIIKGYWKIGSDIDFIISDPNDNSVGPFGYLEHVVDAETMLSNMEIHVPRYFIIPTE